MSTVEALALGLVIGFFVGRRSLARLIERLDSNQRLARETMHEAFKGRDEFRNRAWEYEAACQALLAERHTLVAELMSRGPKSVVRRAN